MLESACLAAVAPFYAAEWPSHVGFTAVDTACPEECLERDERIGRLLFKYGARPPRNDSNDKPLAAPASLVIQGTPAGPSTDM